MLHWFDLIFNIAQDCRLGAWSSWTGCASDLDNKCAVNLLSLAGLKIENCFWQLLDFLWLKNHVVFFAFPKISCWEVPGPAGAGAGSLQGKGSDFSTKQRKHISLCSTVLTEMFIKCSLKDNARLTGQEYIISYAGLLFELPQWDCLLLHRVWFPELSIVPFCCSIRSMSVR